MADEYIAISADLTAVADAIRSKGGTADKLVFPDGYVSAVNAITTGGTSGEIEPFPSKDAGVDWNTFVGVYWVLDSTALPLDHPARRVPMTYNNGTWGNIYTVEFGIMDGDTFIVKDTYDGAKNVYGSSYAFSDITVPDYCKRYTIARITAKSASKAMLNIGYISAPLGTQLATGFVVGLYGRLPDMTAYFGSFPTGQKLMDCKVFDLTTGALTAHPHLFDYFSALQNVGNINTTSATNMSYMFNGCSSLTTLDLGSFDTTSVTNMQNMFYGCNSLTDFKSCVWYKSISFTNSSKLTHDSLMSIINNLATVTSKRTLTIGATNKAKLTDDEIAVATEKGWTVA